MVTGLKDGSLDWIAPLTAAQWANLQGQSHIVVGETKIEQTDVLAFNTLAEVGKGSTAALQDPKFRDAVGYAIDQGAIVSRAFQGHADPGVGPIPPIAETYYSDLHDIQRQFDPVKAGQLLDAAGYKLSGNGIRSDKQGNDIRLQLVYGTLSGTNQFPAAVVELIVAWLGQIGIPVTATRLDSAALYSKLELPSRGGGGFDLVVASRWYAPDAVSLLQIGATPTFVANNLSYWSNKEYDDLVNQVSVTVDVSTRKALVDKAARLIYTEAPFIFLDYPYQLDAHRDDHFIGWGDPDAVSTWSYFPLDRLRPT
jgi:peptide/nickel transport system substrate-binding protein